ncbi:Protein kinase C-like 1, partial [Bienertia sinuspersici]
MSCLSSHAFTTPYLSKDYMHVSVTPKFSTLKCHGLYNNKDNNNPSKTRTKTNYSSITTHNKDRENVALQLAWYASEMLGLASALLRSPPSDLIDNCPELLCDETGAVDRTAVVETIKKDFQRSYFFTGKVTLGAYEEDCRFGDPIGSYKGLARFKRNCINLGTLVIKPKLKLMKWEDFKDRSIGHWRFTFILSFPWRPIIS